MRKIAIPMLVAALFTVGCGKDLIGKAQQKKHGEEAAPVTVVALKDAVPCFGCHDYERYTVGKGKKIPHLKHRNEMGIMLHCNQCHEVKDLNGGKGHVVTITKKNQPCNGCHPALLARVAPHGALVLSGVLERQAEDVIATYRTSDPHVALSVWRTSEGWACLAGRRVA